ncbi:aldo/keto reductase [Actinomadura craniellae]|uniref:Aldo/keto reductase n=1 Tax=Actinomadura craniellae TaxID=2231787 RepID=A0A365H6H5_9ACTN|nr:aldo/keto reductase [Actinomadura craniellae]RAY14602.1 aldo/keto reductase [Actinomadura craniellae]
MADPGIVLGLHRSRHERRALTGALDLGVTHLDTAFNYRSFTSHTTLSTIAADLLDRFTISTKIGFFQTPHGIRHSLDPKLLSASLRQTNKDLGRQPDLVFLHNPERSLRTNPARARERLYAACVLLEDAVAKGLCHSWGIASWDTTPLPDLIDPAVPRPAVLMVRAGLLTGIDVLDTAAELSARWELRTGATWGMSPFGGDVENLPLSVADPRLFLAEDAQTGCSRLQAAFQVAYHLPTVGRIAVGTDNPAHLRALIEARQYTVDRQKTRLYLEFLRHRREAITPAEAPRRAAPRPREPAPAADHQDARAGRRSSPDRTAS